MTIARYKIYIGGGIVLWSEQFAVGTDQQDRLLKNIVSKCSDIRKLEIVAVSAI